MKQVSNKHNFFQWNTVEEIIKQNKSDSRDPSTNSKTINPNFHELFHQLKQILNV